MDDFEKEFSERIQESYEQKGVTKQLMHRIRKTHKHVSDEDFEFLLQRSIDTQIPLTRGAIERYGLEKVGKLDEAKKIPATVTFGITSEIKEALKVMAARHNVSVNKFVKTLVNKLATGELVISTEVWDELSGDWTDPHNRGTG